MPDSPVPPTDCVDGKVLLEVLDQGQLFAAMRPWLRHAQHQPDPFIESDPQPESDPGPSTVLKNAATPAHRLPAAIEGSVLEGLKVLVVDDDYRNIFAMTAVLERGDAIVEVAESGPEAIATLERTPDIDVVLMDIMMPGVDGYDTIRAIRQYSRFEVLPIVAVTGKAASGERERCLDAGADDYIPKPVDTGVLLTSLTPWLPTPREPGTG